MAGAIGNRDAEPGAGRRLVRRLPIGAGAGRAGGSELCLCLRSLPVSSAFAALRARVFGLPGDGSGGR